MKIALITDQHIGCRNDSQAYLNYFRRFYENVFFPYVDEHKITTIIDLGDTLDRRKYINYNTLHQFHDMWLKPIEDRKLKVHAIVGNHQTYFRNTNDVNSANLLFSDSIKVYDEPKHVTIDGLKIAMLPWVNRENYDACENFIKKSKAPVLMGHLELSGYQVVRGIKCDHGMDPGMFSKFNKVFSGHFHIKQQKGNIDYLGTPYEITFADANMSKGFHVFDTETLELTFIENPEKLHYYIPYDDSKVDYSKLDVDEYIGKVVKVNVIEKNDSYLFEKFIDRLVAVGPLKYTIIDQTEALDFGVADESYESKDTMDILVEYINENYEDEADRSEITKLMRELYNEAVSVE